MTTSFAAVPLFLNGDVGTIAIVAALGFVAVGGLAYVVIDGLDGARRAKRLSSGGQAGGSRAAAPHGQAKKGGLFGLFDVDPNSAEARRRTLKRAEQQKVGFKDRLEMTGLKINPFAFIAIFALLAAGVGVGAAYLGAPPLAAAGAATVLAFLGPNMIIGRMINKRRQKFLDAFPNAIDILVRGVKAGLPVNEGLRVIVDEVPGPLGEEIERMIAATNVGFSLEDAAGELAKRVPSPDVNFFRTVLVIQKQTGGNLAEALGNLSEIIRERQKLRKKVWALSSEARMSAIIIGSLPIIVGIMVYLMRPDYLNIMFVKLEGQIALGGAGVWMLFGALIMRAMINFKA